jgi:hypothetical protein
MRKLLLATAAAGGLMTLTPFAASAAPVAAGPVAAGSEHVEKVKYYYCHACASYTADGGTAIGSVLNRLHRGLTPT